MGLLVFPFSGEIKVGVSVDGLLREQRKCKVGCISYGYLQLFYIYCSKIYFSLSHSLAHLSYNANVIIINMSAQAYQPPLLSLIIICSHYNWCFTFVSNYPLIIISDRHTHAQVVVNCQLLRVQGHFSFFHPFR